ncbi:hypothetical protein [Paraglaciecola sp. 2405UD69-4]|uniref:hypothetical protein n=1 Tax=Paraglaciecola sp. 2405UD69-4 TaxID=3391836 RepID=UPI0039C9423B
MKKLMLLLSLFWFSFGAYSHGFDYSVVRLIEQDNDKWRLVVVSSLDAFRKEVKQHFADSPYTSVEQFNAQLLSHINATLKIATKDTEVSLGTGKVQLGHETSIIFDEVALPKGAQAMTLINGALKDIYRHTTKLIVAEQGQDGVTFILNKKNNFTANFSVQ